MNNTELKNIDTEINYIIDKIRSLQKSVIDFRQDSEDYSEEKRWLRQVSHKLDDAYKILMKIDSWDYSEVE